MLYGVNQLFYNGISKETWILKKDALSRFTLLRLNGKEKYLVRFMNNKASVKVEYYPRNYIKSS